MYFIRPPFFLRWFNPDHLLLEVPVTEKIIFLTFDDGPDPEATPTILEILGRCQAKATFFMVGENIRRYPSTFETVREQGHSVGNHTFHHLNGWHTAPGAYLEDVDRCRELVDTPLFRPPYGKFTPSQYFLLHRQYRFILWSVLTYDFDKRVSPEKCLDISIKNSRNGSVVVFHDNTKSIDKVKQVLPLFLAHFAALGYRFEVVQ